MQHAVFDESEARLQRGDDEINIYAQDAASLIIVYAVPQRDTEGAQQLGGLEQGQAQHARVTAFEPRDEHRASPLYRIRTRLVGRFAARPVACALVLVQHTKAYRTHAQAARLALVVHQGDRSIDMMCAPG